MNKVMLIGNVGKEPDVRYYEADQAVAQIALATTARGVKDLIIWGADRSFDFRVFERLRILGANMTFFDQVVPGPFADYVGLDNRAALEALIGQAAADGAASGNELGKAAERMLHIR